MAISKHLCIFAADLKNKNIITLALRITDKREIMKIKTSKYNEVRLSDVAQYIKVPAQIVKPSVTLDDLKESSILEDNGYSLEQSVGGSWRLMRDDVLIYDDPACEGLNEDESTAVAFFTGYFKEYVKSYSMDYENYHVNITEDSEYYHIDFSTGLGEAHYPKSDWTLEEALKDQAEI